MQCMYVIILSCADKHIGKCISNSDVHFPICLPRIVIGGVHEQCIAPYINTLVYVLMYGAMHV
jgi:hypothetical protein